MRKMSKIGTQCELNFKCIEWKQNRRGKRKNLKRRGIKQSEIRDKKM